MVVGSHPLLSYMCFITPLRILFDFTRLSDKMTTIAFQGLSLHKSIIHEKECSNSMRISECDNSPNSCSSVEVFDPSISAIREKHVQCICSNTKTQQLNQNLANCHNTFSFSLARRIQNLQRYTEKVSDIVQRSNSEWQTSNIEHDIELQLHICVNFSKRR